MTDDKDKLEETPSLQEEVSPVESEETWQDELPPEDDFHDQAEFQEYPQEDVLDEAEAQDAPEEQEMPVETTKRGSGVLLGALVVGGLFVGGLAYLQFGSGGSKEGTVALPAAAVFDVTNIQKEAGAGTPQPSVDENLAKTSAQTDLDKMFKGTPSAQGGATAMPSHNNGEVVAEKPVQGISSEILSSSSEPSPTVVPMPAPTMEEISQAAKVEPIPAPGSLDEKPVAAVVPAPVPVTAAKAVPPEVESRLNNMTAQIESLKKALDDATQKNTTLLSRLETLQKQKADADKAAEAATAKEAALAASRPVLVEVGNKVEPVIAPQPQPEAGVSASMEGLAPKPVRKSASVSTKKTAVHKAPAKKTSSSQKWVLRAATPDAAWVAKGANTDELKRIGVGEKLSGLGRIKEIRQNGDSWEVVGESGVLR